MEKEIIIRPSVYNNFEMESVTKESGRTYITPNGDVYQSITTVLSKIPKPSLEEWKERVGEEEAKKASERGKKRGQAVHDALESHFFHQVPVNNIPSLTNKMILKCFSQIVEVMYDNVDEIWFMEQATYSDSLQIAGRVDMVAVWNGEFAIVDFKTASGYQERDWISNYFLQEAFYSVCMKERYGLSCNKLVTIIASEKINKAQVEVEDFRDHLPRLVETVQQYRDV